MPARLCVVARDSRGSAQCSAIHRDTKGIGEMPRSLGGIATAQATHHSVQAGALLTMNMAQQSRSA